MIVVFAQFKNSGQGPEPGPPLAVAQDQVMAVAANLDGRATLVLVGGDHWQVHETYEETLRKLHWEPERWEWTP